MGNFASVGVEKNVTWAAPFKAQNYPGGIFALPAD